MPPSLNVRSRKGNPVAKYCNFDRANIILQCYNEWHQQQWMLIIPNNKFEEFLAAININCQSDSEAGPRIRSGLGYQNQSTSKERGILHGWKVWDSIQKLVDLEKRPEFSRHIMHVHREWYHAKKARSQSSSVDPTLFYRLFHAVEECIYNEHLIF